MINSNRISITFEHVRNSLQFHTLLKQTHNEKKISAKIASGIGAYAYLQSSLAGHSESEFQVVSPLAGWRTNNSLMIQGIGLANNYHPLHILVSSFLVASLITLIHSLSRTWIFCLRNNILCEVLVQMMRVACWLSLVNSHTTSSCSRLTRTWELMELSCKLSLVNSHAGHKSWWNSHANSRCTPLYLPQGPLCLAVMYSLRRHAAKSIKQRLG